MCDGVFCLCGVNEYGGGLELACVCEVCAARVPRCLRYLMFMLSGPTELLFLDCVMVFFVCVVLMSMGVVWSLRVCVRYVRARVPRCLKYLMFMLSGPTD